MAAVTCQKFQHMIVIDYSHWRTLEDGRQIWGDGEQTTQYELTYVVD
ncbi:MAG: hypothetical protein ACQET8_09530 [Bacillota bacterium]